MSQRGKRWGYPRDGWGYYNPDGDPSRLMGITEDELVGALLRELDRLTDGDFAYFSRNYFSRGNMHEVSLRDREARSDSILDVLTLAVEKAKEDKSADK